MADQAATDVAAFYAALGIDLPAWAQRNAAVRCFANPDAHARNDRTPSCSVSLESGAWLCHGCGAHGGAYDAAIALGHSPRSAIDLMVRYGLADRRAPDGHRNRVPRARVTPTRGSGHPERRLAATEADVQRWHRALMSAHSTALRHRLARERGWDELAIEELGLGLDGSRITIPIREADGQLCGVLRYLAGAQVRKMLAIPGSHLGLIPHPASETSQRILLVEGPPDMIAARSRRWPAIAVPGTHAWRPAWAQLLRGRDVVVVMDSDGAGRDAAQRIVADLRPLAIARTVDLAPGRSDGFDLTDWLLMQPHQRRATCNTSSSSRPTIRR